jgi:hypothetical protein
VNCLAINAPHRIKAEGSTRGKGKAPTGAVRGTTAGNHPIAATKVADRNVSRMQAESHSSSTGSGGGSKRH